MAKSDGGNHRKSNRKAKFVFTSKNGKEKKIGKDEGLKPDYLATKSYQLTAELNSLEDAKEYWKEEKRKLREIGARVHKYPTYKSLLNSGWKRERLHVGDVANLPEKSTKEETHSEFFKIISGRPIKEKKNMSAYLSDIKSCFLTRLKTGYHRDEILLIDEHYTMEKGQLEKVEKTLLSILQGFESFLMEDHMFSQKLLNLAKEESEKSKEKLRVLSSLRENVKDIEMRIIMLEEEWRKVQEILRVAAPADWKRVNDPNYEKRDSEGSATDSCLFDRFRDFPQESEPPEVNLQSHVSRFTEGENDCREAKFNFTHPQQIHDIIAELEKNNLRALNNCKKLDFPAANAIAEVQGLKLNLEKSQSKLEEDIDYIKNMVEMEEKKAIEMEEELREMIYGLFRNLITNDEYLSITAFLEDAYEDAVGSIDTNPDPVTMIKEIESKYESLSLALDLLPNSLVVQTTENFYKELKMELREAKKAERKVYQMEMLLKRLSKALQAPRKGKKDRKMTPRSQPLEEKLSQTKEAIILTKEEINRIHFFGRTSETARLYRPLCI